MILQTGGSALGDISTRSNSNWSANFIASVNLKTLAQYFRLQDVPLAHHEFVYSVGIFLFYEVDNLCCFLLLWLYNLS
jgi:hypothetical protein